MNIDSETKFKVGDRVECIKTDFLRSPIKKGMRGVIRILSSVGPLGVEWDNYTNEILLRGLSRACVNKEAGAYIDKEAIKKISDIEYRQELLDEEFKNEEKFKTVLIPSGKKKFFFD